MCVHKCSMDEPCETCFLVQMEGVSDTASKLLSIPGGKEIFKEMAEAFVKLTPKEKSMLSELINKLGEDEYG